MKKQREAKATEGLPKGTGDDFLSSLGVSMQSFHATFKQESMGA